MKLNMDDKTSIMQEITPPSIYRIIPEKVLCYKVFSVSWRTCQGITLEWFGTKYRSM